MEIISCIFVQSGIHAITDNLCCFIVYSVFNHIVDHLDVNKNTTTNTTNYGERGLQNGRGGEA